MRDALDINWLVSLLSENYVCIQTSCVLQSLLSLSDLKLNLTRQVQKKKIKMTQEGGMHYSLGTR